MAKRSVNWIAEMAGAMRVAGAVYAKRTSRNQDGSSDEYEVRLEEPRELNVKLVHGSIAKSIQEPGVQHDHEEPPQTEALMKDTRIINQYYDLFGRQPTEEELKIYRQMPTLLG